MSNDQDFDLERFVRAQSGSVPGGSGYQTALSELRAGQKRSHWMWYVFPQVAGLGNSEYAIRYAISGIPEAKAYLAHPVLGPRLVECSTALLAIEGKTTREILGGVDTMKLCSSMTLFERVADDFSVFVEVLEKYYDGVRDARTLAILASRA
jgi:uncharacterized protein (DUF1810 family)